MPDSITDADLVTLKRLEAGLAKDQPDIKKYDLCYEGKQPLNFVAPALRDEIGDTVTELVINWARTVADAFENRLDIEGFRYPGALSGDDDLWAVWQANNMDEQSQMAHLDSLVLRRSYVIVGPGEGDAPPLITVESPTQAWAERDPRNRRVTNGLKRWREIDRTERAGLYLPNYSVEYAKSGETWVETWRDNHGVGVSSMVALPNRPRLMAPDGVSELVDVMPLADAANKMATDMMISGEFHAMPRRWATGIKAEDFEDADGNPVSTWEKMVGRIWATEEKDAKLGTFTETDLKVFHDTIKMLAALVSQLAALPPHYLGFGDVNPTSADAIRSSETQLVKKVMRKQTFLSGGWEDVQRLVLRYQTGAFDPKARALETVWRDPSTPTDAQRADALLKKVTSGIYTIGEARRQDGLTDAQIKRMEREEDEAGDRVIDGITRTLANPGG